MRPLNGGCCAVFVMFLSVVLVVTAAASVDKKPAADVIPLDEETWREVLDKEWLIQL